MHFHAERSQQFSAFTERKSHCIKNCGINFYDGDICTTLEFSNIISLIYYFHVGQFKCPWHVLKKIKAKLIRICRQNCMWNLTYARDLKSMKPKTNLITALSAFCPIEGQMISHDVYSVCNFHRGFVINFSCTTNM